MDHLDDLLRGLERRIRVFGSWQSGLALRTLQDPGDIQGTKILIPMMHFNHLAGFPRGLKIYLWVSSSWRSALTLGIFGPCVVTAISFDDRVKRKISRSSDTSSCTCHRLRNWALGRPALLVHLVLMAVDPGGYQIMTFHRIWMQTNRDARIFPPKQSHAHWPQDIPSFSLSVAHLALGMLDVWRVLLKFWF